MELGSGSWQVNSPLLSSASFVVGNFQVLAIPAVPLTMSAGLLFGTLYGTIMVSIAGTVSGVEITQIFTPQIFRVLALPISLAIDDVS